MGRLPFAKTQNKMIAHTPQTFLESLCGTYDGTHSVWFEPGPPVDAAPMEVEIRESDIPGLVGIAYRYTFQDKSHLGRMTLAFAKTDPRYQLSWVDSLHGAGRIIHFEGGNTPAAIEAGFSVSGTYPVDPETYWGWRIDIFRDAADGILIQHFNRPLGQDEAVAVEMRLHSR